MDFSHQRQEQNSPNLRALTDAGDLETQFALSRHHPVGIFLGKAFPKSLGPLCSSEPCDHMLHWLLSGDPAVKPSFCHRLTSFSTQASKQPESTLLQEPLCNHTLWSISSLTPWPESLWWWWSTARLPRPPWAHQPSSPSSAELRAPHGRCCLGTQSQRNLTASKSISILPVLSAGLSAVSQPYLRRKTLQSWKMPHLSLCRRWEPSLLVANEHQ